MKNKTFLPLAILICAVTACITHLPVQVKVEGGWIQGIIEEELMVFKGIPFAAPPVGDLRWVAPQPVEKWEGVKEWYW